MDYDESFARAQRAYDNQSDDRFDNEDEDKPCEPAEDIDSIEQIFILAKKLIL